MKSFAYLFSQWEEIRVGIPKDDLDKIYDLFSLDASQVSSSFELLYSYGDVALCAILEEKGNQIVLREHLGFNHHILWKRCVVEEVCREENDWNGLYLLNFFSQMEFRVLGEGDWSEFSEHQKQKVIEESLRSILIQPDTFRMGTPRDWYTGYEHEHPLHQVTFTKSVEMCVYPVTQALYEAVMGNNPSANKGMIKPVDSVSWCDAIVFCNTLSEMRGLTPCYTFSNNVDNPLSWARKVRWDHTIPLKNGYRLPTEAEWEYAACGDEDFKYSGSDNAHEVAWYGEARFSGATHNVGEKKGNGFGLYDMSGNVWEWVFDAWDRKAYQRGDRVNPVVQDNTSVFWKRVERGGSCFSDLDSVRVTYRGGDSASRRKSTSGFRLVRYVSS